jgi:hypothetical protein
VLGCPSTVAAAGARAAGRELVNELESKGRKAFAKVRCQASDLWQAPGEGRGRWYWVVAFCVPAAPVKPPGE